MTDSQGKLMAAQSAATQLRMGIYRHYKGHLYEVTGLAHDANADVLGHQVGPKGSLYEGEVWPLGERIVVIYRPLELDDAHEGPRTAVRNILDFVKLVCWDKECHVRGQSPDAQCIKDYDDIWPRFKFLGAVYSHNMRQNVEHD